jgi:hypothetical protein
MAVRGLGQAAQVQPAIGIDTEAQAAVVAALNNVQRNAG